MIIKWIKNYRHANINNSFFISKTRLNIFNWFNFFIIILTLHTTIQPHSYWLISLTISHSVLIFSLSCANAKNYLSSHTFFSFLNIFFALCLVLHNTRKKVQLIPIVFKCNKSAEVGNLISFCVFLLFFYAW